MRAEYRRTMGLAPVALLLLAAPGTAQTPAPVRSVWDSAYTAEQATRGQAVFRSVCGVCHSTAEFTGADHLAAWDGGTAWQLYKVVHDQMPEDDPGSLPAEQCAAVLAYIFQLNGFPAGRRPLPADADALKHVLITLKPESP